MSHVCKQLHELIQELPKTRWPFDSERLPRNGIYFFYEEGETWGHGSEQQRIVRVGTHREGNFRSRLSDHYVNNEQKMKFTRDQVAPKDRSIFRKNIGRALLHRNRDAYETVWNIDFTTLASREKNGFLRDIEKERQIEVRVTQILRERFGFHWIELEGQEQRMGKHGLEATLVGTLASCGECMPSPNWLGRFSPKLKIAQSGLWQEQHLRASTLTNEDTCLIR